MAHRLLLPARSLPAGDRGVSRFSRMEFLFIGHERRRTALLIRGQGLRSSSLQGQGSSTTQGRASLAFSRRALLSSG